MSRIFFYSFLISFFGLLQLSAQEKSLQGKVTNDADIDGIHVLNTSSRFNTITNENGHFSINVKPLDTLLFSSIKYMPEKVVVTETIFEKGVITIKLTELVNELDEVFLQPNLSGNIATDLKKIKTEKPINYDDVGIPGFKGEPEEKIVPLYFVVTPTSINIDALYKYLSGYYKNLKIRRKWEVENNAVARMLNYYTVPFFTTTYGIPENRVYDFLLFCAETTTIESDFKKEHYGSVLLVLDEKAKIYAERITEENKK
ncbi:MAG: carboxypeptidase-like regulatory domain-containing protein [Flavobacteriaceae bacterium]|nr:carboxypeptidase-like regulatory domain-containing protein [Flavobacteriaceae bacterium]